MGPLFALHVALWLVHGARTGGLLVEAATPLAQLDGVVFSLAYGCIAVALWAVGGTVQKRWAVNATRLLAAVAALGTTVGAVTFIMVGEPVGGAFAVATLALFASALVAGGALVAEGSRVTGALLLLFGATTLPLGIALPLLLGGMLPEYVGYESHFLAAGAWWAALAWRAPR